MKNEKRTYGEHAERARQMWAAFTDNEKHGVRFGMFPNGPMQAAIADGYDNRKLCGDLMDIADKNGGMRA